MAKNKTAYGTESKSPNTFVKNTSYILSSEYVVESTDYNDPSTFYIGKDATILEHTDKLGVAFNGVPKNTTISKFNPSYEQTMYDSDNTYDAELRYQGAAYLNSPISVKINTGFNESTKVKTEYTT